MAARNRSERLRFAPKVPVGWIVQLYRRDAMLIQDEERLAKVGGRLYTRCLDVLMVSDEHLECPECQTRFSVPWIGQPPDRVYFCPRCNWSITAGAFHASFEHQDLLGGNAREAFAAFVEQYPQANGYAARMLLIDRLVHAVHAGGGLVARNVLEGRPQQVLAMLDELAEASR
jgi:ribosomal protein L37AE/L43A